MAALKFKSGDFALYKKFDGDCMFVQIENRYKFSVHEYIAKFPDGQSPAHYSFTVFDKTENTFIIHDKYLEHLHNVMVCPSCLSPRVYAAVMVSVNNPNLADTIPDKSGLYICKKCDTVDSAAALMTADLIIIDLNDL
jgi:hypothetical protein